jgi:thiol:disulfide interchange protein DsbD
LSQNLTRIVFALTALLLGTIGAGAQFKIPSPDEVFRLSVSKGSDGSVNLDWSIAPDTYLYRDKVIVTTPDAKPVQVETSPGQQKDDPTFGATEVYHNSAHAVVAASASEAAGSLLAIQVTYQGCAEKLGICYPPVTRSVNLETLAVADADAPSVTSNRADADRGSAPSGASLWAGPPETAWSVPPSGAVSAPQAASQDNSWLSGSLASVLATFLAFGLLLTFTPCVLPMIPILSGMLARG